MNEFSRFTLEWWTVILAGVSTLAIFSFLYKENPFFRFFEHVFIGIAVAYGLLTQIKNFLWPKLLVPILGLDRSLLPDGTYLEPYNYYNLLYLLPMAFGCLYYFILSPRHSWLAYLVIGFSFGVSAGLTVKGTFIELMPQVYDSFRPLYVAGDPWKSLENIFFLLTLLSAMSYFFFTTRRRAGSLAEKFSTSGRWLLMGCFGAYFGSTIMARMALLVERVDFLFNKWFVYLGIL